MVKNNDYKKDHQLASSNAIAEKLESHYIRKMNKNGNKVVKCIEETSKEQQYKGIDRRLFVRKGTKLDAITIEEKIRRNFYNDILLEVVSNDTYPMGTVKNIGWIKKELECNLIAFYFMQQDRLFMFDWKIFQKTYELHGPEWIEKAINEENGFKWVQARNSRTYPNRVYTYFSHSLIVPSKELIKRYMEVYKEKD